MYFFSSLCVFCRPQLEASDCWRKMKTPASLSPHRTQPIRFTHFQSPFLSPIENLKILHTVLHVGGTTRVFLDTCSNLPTSDNVECKIMSHHFVSAVSCHLSLTQATTEFEDLIASLKISKGSQQTPPLPAPPQAPTSQSDSPLSPQSFAMVSITGTDWLRLYCRE